MVILLNGICNKSLVKILSTKLSHLCIIDKLMTTMGLPVCAWVSRLSCPVRVLLTHKSPPLTHATMPGLEGQSFTSNRLPGQLDWISLGNTGRSYKTTSALSSNLKTQIQILLANGNTPNQCFIT